MSLLVAALTVLMFYFKLIESPPSMTKLRVI